MRRVSKGDGDIRAIILRGSPQNRLAPQDDERFGSRLTAFCRTAITAFPKFNSDRDLPRHNAALHLSAHSHAGCFRRMS